MASRRTGLGFAFDDRLRANGCAEKRVTGRHFAGNGLVRYDSFQGIQDRSTSPRQGAGNLASLFQ